MENPRGERAVLNEYEAAEYVGLAVQTMRNKRFRREAPAYFKIGKAVRYRIKDLESFLMQHRIEPEAA